MCLHIVVKRDKEEIYCETVGELAAALNVNPSQISLLDDDDEESCLCNARLEELNARLATEEEGWPFPEYIIDVSRSPQNPETGAKP